MNALAIMATETGGDSSDEPRFRAETFLSTASRSIDAGTQIGAAITQAFGAMRPALVLLYASISHDAELLVGAVRKALGPGPRIVGCSTQGIFDARDLFDGGYFAGAIAFGGAGLEVAVDVVRAIEADTQEKGRSLGRGVSAALSATPKAVIVLYDPLVGADVEVLVGALHEEVRCPVVGGGAGQDVGPMIRTLQFVDTEVFSGGAIAIGLGGAFSVESDVCHGSTPLGITMEVTRAVDNVLFTLDGRSALEVWRELSGETATGVEHTSSLGLAERVEPGEGRAELVRSKFGEDEEGGGVILQARVAEGAHVTVHHRTVAQIVDGARAMGARLASKLGDRKRLAVLGFECGARSTPFLGAEMAARENIELRRIVARNAPWLGTLAWGEIFADRGVPRFANYAYPIIVFVEAEPQRERATQETRTA